MVRSTVSQNLQALLYSIPESIINTSLNFPVSGICFDSRNVEPGDLYFAIKGEIFDGHDYLLDVVASGAAGIIGTKEIADFKIPYIHVENSRLALAHIASSFFGYPSKKMVIIGVTGTDGKTTTASLIYQILKNAGIKVGLLSTVSACLGEDTIDTGYHVTTPDAITIQTILNQMVDSGLTHAVLEITSHGLSQYRVSAIDFNIGVITNLTHEHLDYHGSFMAYREAKALLFKQLSPKIYEEDLFYGAVLNVDDPSFEYFNMITSAPVYRYGIENKADFWASNVVEKSDSIEFTISSSSGLPDTEKHQAADLLFNLSGKYNLYNCLAAIATTSGIFGIDLKTIKRSISNLIAIPGRMEEIILGQEFRVFVDFAHTPNALKNALIYAKSVVDRGGMEGRVIAVFGSAGLRDREKRVLMTKISAEYADFSIITAEDPRTESVETILDEMEDGFKIFDKQIGKNYLKIMDRREAILEAVFLAKKGDLVIVCGKGHEQSMCFGNIEYSWDDRTAVKAALSILMGIDGPEMPYLPIAGS